MTKKKVEIEIEYHENGNKKSELIGDRMRLYHEDGRHYAEGTFRNGFMEDYWAFESPSGLTYSVGKLKKNVQTGVWNTFKRNGEPVRQQIFKNGVEVPKNKFKKYFDRGMAILLFEIINIDYFIEKFGKKPKKEDDTVN